MDKEYLRKQYYQAILEFRTAHNEDDQWNARKQTAKIEWTALEMFGDEFLDEIRKENGLKAY